MSSIGQVVYTSDNDQVKAAWKDYVNVKPVWPVCVFVATMLEKQKAQGLSSRINVNLM